MITSQKGIDLIKSFEGCKLEAYLCPAGVWTIGYGTTKDVKEGMKITEAEAEILLRQDVKAAERIVNFFLTGLNQNQFDSLIAFCYNIGSGNFRKSTLLKKAKTNPLDVTIRDEFMRWTKAGGKVLAGLEKRRKAEADLYFNLDYF